MTRISSTSRAFQSCRIIVLTVSLTAASVTTALADPPVSTDNHSTPARSKDLASQPADVIVVTGTRGMKRSVASSTTPINVISSNELKTAGKSGLQEALGDLLPSFALPSQAGGNISSIVRTATMRGLDSDQVLVLVNGKRRHVGSVVNVSGTVNTGSQAVDLNLIPLAAIDHIEVLSDGAAAQYGSDAIAGVINVILKNQDHGGTAYASSGIYGAGDGLTWQGDIDHGFKLGNDGFVHVSLEGIREDHTGRALVSTLPYYYTGDPRNNLPHRVTYSGYGQPQQRTINLVVNLEKPLTSGVTFYGMGTYSYNSGMQWENFRQPASNDSVLAIFPNGYQPRENIRQNDFSITAGFKGADLFGWRWDLSSTYGKNYSKIYTLNTVNSTLGVNSPTDFYDGEWESSEITNDFDINRAFRVPRLAAPLNVAIGVEQRVDSYRIKAGDPASYENGGQPILTGPNAGTFQDTPGANSQSGFLPSQQANLWRNNVGAYTDLETRITPNWQLGLAGRFEHYDDYGNDEIGKVSTRYDVNRWLAVRGSLSNGFRAPSLGEEGFQAQNTSFYLGVPYNSVNLPVYSAAAQAIGAKALRPETSMDYSVGFVLTPIRHMTITVDTYQVTIAHRIVESAYLGLLPNGSLNPALRSLLSSYGLEGVGAARFFLNGAKTRTRGADLVADYLTDLGRAGYADWTASLNLNETEILSLSDLAKQTIYGTQVLNGYAQRNLTTTSPKSHLILGVNYTFWKWNFIVHEHRWGSLVATSTVTDGDSYLSPHWTTDLDIGYRLTPALRVSVGAQNLFNAYPDRTNALNFKSSTFNGAQIYNANSPYGISGGFYYIHANYQF